WIALDIVEGGAQRSLSSRRGSHSSCRVALPPCEAGGSGFTCESPRRAHRRLLRLDCLPSAAITRGDATRDVALRPTSSSRASLRSALVLERSQPASQLARFGVDDAKGRRRSGNRSNHSPPTFTLTRRTRAGNRAIRVRSSPSRSAREASNPAAELAVTSVSVPCESPPIETTSRSRGGATSSQTSIRSPTSRCRARNSRSSCPSCTPSVRSRSRRPRNSRIRSIQAMPGVRGPSGWFAEPAEFVAGAA
ncbi:MAG: hypothetical protein RIR10_1586, partial [Planctomycetota bacterium]